MDIGEDAQGDEASVRMPEQDRRSGGVAELARRTQHRREVAQVGCEAIDIAALARRLAVAADVVGQRGPARVGDDMRDLVVAAAVLRVAVGDEEDALGGPRGAEGLGIEACDRLGGRGGDRAGCVTHERLLYLQAGSARKLPADQRSAYGRQYVA